mgnify:CR=1 FL=1
MTFSLSDGESSPSQSRSSAPLSSVSCVPKLLEISSAAVREGSSRAIQAGAEQIAGIHPEEQRDDRDEESRAAAQRDPAPTASTAATLALGDALAAGLQVMIHAIGDRAIRAQLDVYERVARELGPAARVKRLVEEGTRALEALRRLAEGEP